MPSSRIEIISNLAAPLAASLGLELWGVEILGAARPLVRVYLDVPSRAAEPEKGDPAHSEAEKGASAQSEAATAAEGATEPPQDVTPPGVTPPGVTIDQCAELSRLLGLSLDVEDCFPSGWTLEVSSPGLERPFFRLDQLPPYQGRELEVTLSAPLKTWPGRRKFCGPLVRVDAQSFTLDLPLAPVARRRADEAESVEIPWTFVRKATLIHSFPERNAPGSSGKHSGGAV